MPAITSATIALALAMEMDATHQPNTGNYVDGMDGVGQIANADLVNIWIQGQPESVRFPEMPAWDINSTPDNQGGVIDPSAVACSLAYMSCCRKRGVAMFTIAISVQANPYLILTEMAAAPSWNEFMTDMRVAGWPQNNDPCGGFGVVFPSVPTLSEQIYDMIASDMANNLPKSDSVIKLQLILTPSGS